MRGEVTQRTGGVKPELAWFSRNHFLARPQRPDQRRGRRLDFVIGQNSGLISIFNLGRQTIKTSRNKPNMSKVKRQVGPRSCLATASCKEAQIGLVGCSVRGAWEAADRCYDQQPTSENLIDQAHTFGCRSRAQAELSTYV